MSKSRRQIAPDGKVYKLNVFHSTCGCRNHNRTQPKQGYATRKLALHAAAMHERFAPDDPMGRVRAYKCTKGVWHIGHPIGSQDNRGGDA